MKPLLTALLLLSTFFTHAQNNQQATLSAIYSNALSSYDAYENLRELCADAPGRLVGSPASERAIQMLKEKLSS